MWWIILLVLVSSIKFYPYGKISLQDTVICENSDSKYIDIVWVQWISEDYIIWEREHVYKKKDCQRSVWYTISTWLLSTDVSRWFIIDQ